MSRDWQDIMLEHSNDKNWLAEATIPDAKLVFYGSLCDTILELEKTIKRQSEEYELLASEYKRVNRREL